MSKVTEIPDAVSTGDANAPAELLPLFYNELRQVAAAKLAVESPGQTLNPAPLDSVVSDDQDTQP
ncbi:MAG: ECF-type sigma factor [Planctomycetaceae bacterium]